MRSEAARDFGVEPLRRPAPSSPERSCPCFRPHQRRAIAGHRQDGERSRRQKMFIGDAVVRLFMLHRRDDARSADRTSRPRRCPSARAVGESRPSAATASAADRSPFAKRRDDAGRLHLRDRCSAAGATKLQIRQRACDREQSAVRDMTVLGDMAERRRLPSFAASKCSEKGEAGWPSLASVTRMSSIGWAWGARCSQTPSA